MDPVTLLCCFLALAAAEPTVEGSLGKISGRTDTILNVTIDAFLGIPYAKPPVGELRFALPQPFGAVGNFRADKFGEVCAQPAFPILRVSGEDCLFLNVYRKNGTTRDDRKAVIAIIHGGGYSTGTASDATQNAEPLAGIGDVIVVSFNYRLGIFGFADMNGLAPGNLGLHDQRLALKWIQDHIADFGGDPKRVTLIGFSAGSRSVAAQIISTADKRDLFEAAVMDAGVVPSPGFLETPETSFSRVKRVAEAVGCSTDSDKILQCLRRAPVRKLISESRKQSGSRGFKTFVPTADGVFLPKDVDDYFTKNSSDLRKVRTIIGYSHDEGSIFVLIGDPLLSFKNKKTDDEILGYLEDISRRNKFPLNLNDEQTRQKLREIYIANNTSAFKAAGSFISDARYKCPINSFIEQYSRHNEKVYAYQFERILSRTYYRVINPKILGAFHTSAYAHFSGALFLDGKAVPDADEKFSLESMDMISKFAKSDGDLEFRGVEWPSYSKSGEILIFDEVPAVRKGLASEGNCRDLFSSN